MSALQLPVQNHLDGMRSPKFRGIEHEWLSDVNVSGNTSLGWCTFIYN
ncbi:hypothetical protein J0S82_012075, partial [Galemys pyrenaicus]